MQRESWPGTPAMAGAYGQASHHARPRKENPITRTLGTFGFLADASRRRPGGRFAYWVASVALMLAGASLFAVPFYTAYVASHLQHQAAQQLATGQTLGAYRTHKLAIGEAVTRLRIPKLGVNVIVVEGTSGNALRAGAGHYEETALPGDVGNVAIAGHRTGFGEPFRNLDQLRPGDLIYLDTPLGPYTYKVSASVDGHVNPWITDPDDWAVTVPLPTPTLTLTTCDPPHTSHNRLIVRADMISGQIFA
ncbi:MAG: class E sortase [Actinomycetota bacterium]